MLKLVLDADAWIKLYKSGLLGKACKLFDCIMTRQVFEEVVLTGGKSLRPHALAIEELVKRKRVRLIDIAPGGEHELTLGQGELSVFNACARTGGVPVSDDRQFVGFLTARGMAFHTPTSLIVSMRKNKLVGAKTARAALENLLPLIRRDSFEAALKKLEED